MHERGSRAIRHRGSKYPLPTEDHQFYNNSFSRLESPYYTINNTEDVYSTTLSPFQRCYIDPWDLENYDYVRKKIGKQMSPEDFSEKSLPTIVTKEKYNNYGHIQDQNYINLSKNLATCNKKRSYNYIQNENLGNLSLPNRAYRHNVRKYIDTRESGESFTDNVCYNDYDNSFIRSETPFNNGKHSDNIESYNYIHSDGASSTTSPERRSSIDEDYPTTITQKPYIQDNEIMQRKSSRLNPYNNFTVPPSIPMNYDYCNPYTTLQRCSITDCYKCCSGYPLYPSGYMFGTISMPNSCYNYGYNHKNTYNINKYSRPCSTVTNRSQYYGNNFGLSKKGLLQIDYSYSWSNLDRVVRRRC